jgi:MFS family permease
VIEAPDRGWTAPVVLAGFAVGVTFLALFWRWELHNPTPMLDLRFFRNPRFTAASATITIMMFVMYAATFLMAEYFQFILGYSPLKAGAMLTPVALGLMLGAPTAPRFVAVHGTKRVVVAGLITVAAMTACYMSDTIMSSFIGGFFIRFVYGIGLGTMSAPLTESIMGSLPHERAGVGSAVNDTTRQTGGATGVAVLGSVFAAMYHRHIGTLSFVPVESRRLARESIGTSLQVAARLPADAAQHLHVVARLAFLSSMRVTFGCGVMVTLLALFVAVKYLPARAEVASPTVVGEPAAGARPVGAREPSSLARPVGLVLDDNAGG